MSDRKIDLGPTGETVRENVKRLREEQNLTFAELSRRLEASGNPIPPLGLRRIEAGERRVHADDLVALALVFKGGLTDLLLPNPHKHHEGDLVDATGITGIPMVRLERWMREGLWEYVDPNTKLEDIERTILDQRHHLRHALKEIRMAIDELSNQPGETTRGND